MYGVGAWSAASLQCWVVPLTGKPKDNLPTAIRAQLIFLVTPFLVLAAIVLLRLLWWALMWCVSGVVRSCRGSSGGCVNPRFVKAVTPSPLRLLARKLPLTVLVVLFFAYPTLLRTGLRFFACLPLDSPTRASVNTNNSTVPLLTHKAGYLTMDLNQECWVGWHRSWTIGVGVPTVLITCVLMPVGLFWLLKANAARADELRFRETYGFLYRWVRARGVFV